MNNSNTRRTGWLSNATAGTHAPRCPKVPPPFRAYVRSVTAAADQGPAAETACALAPSSAPLPPSGRGDRTGRMRTPGGRRAAPSEWKDLLHQVRGSRAVGCERAGATGAGQRLRNLGESVCVAPGAAAMAAYKLVLIRHGESAWNLENRFSGWYDADLSPAGHEEAKRGGQALRGVERVGLWVGAAEARAGAAR